MVLLVCLATVWRMPLHSLEMDSIRSLACFTRSITIALIFLSLEIHLTLAADRIFPGESLSGNWTITSHGGKFELGFFTPGNSHNYYIGIWYKKISKKTIVWVANRETPLPNTSSELRITEHGNLMLLNNSKIPIWSTNSTSTLSNSTIVVLLDNGNLVLRDHLNSSTVIWQSFDHPTDTWLPGGKIGFNKITGESWHLTSWRSTEDPSPGPFTNGLKINGTIQFVLLWNGSRQYWSSGPWNGQHFGSVAESNALNDPHVNNRYNYRSAGCVRRTPLECVNNTSIDRKKNGFFMMPDMILPSNALPLKVVSADECQLVCLSNCSCTAYAFQNRCFIWIEDVLNLRTPPDGSSSVVGNVYIRLEASELPSSTDTEGKIIGASVGSAIGALAIVITIYMLYKRRNRREIIEFPEEVHSSLVQFSYNNLKIATKNFSERLGGGSFGSVFKGTLPDSTLIAVKRLERHGQGEKQFRMEVSTVGMIQHVNLVRLRGFCSEGNERMLVYDFMPNGSLESHLFHKNSDVFDWKTRYHIAIGISKGLDYLHDRCRDRIIHCDIKPGNILLDAELRPKVADFGMAKLHSHELSKVLTTMRGTVGYLAPEWICGQPITTKADVYSYGMMLLEIISGTRNSNESQGGTGVYFPIWAARKINEGEVINILDPRLEGNADMDELERACRVACWCIQDDENCRPSMGQVVQILGGALMIEIPPIPLYLQHLAEGQESLFCTLVSRKKGVQEKPRRWDHG